MQKITKIFNTALFFLPAIILISILSLIPRIVVSAINPLGSFEYLKNVSITNIANGVNPFKDFSFDFLSEKKNDTSHSNSSNSINPNYNVSEEFFASQESNIVIKKDECYVKNLTHLNSSEVKSIMLSPVGFKAEKNSDNPQILIMHTHATESYVPTADMPFNPNYAYRNTDTNLNMVAVGKVMTDTLNKLGYNTIQDSTLHDYPSYNGSYDKSKETVKKYLEKYPSIKIVLDIHRDAVERSGTIISPTVTLDGTKYAQIMIISGADNGYMNMPNYKENLKFATTVQNQISKTYPNLARPILFDYRNYNQQLTTGSILVEIGTHGSTLSQAKNSGRAFAECLAKALDNM